MQTCRSIPTAARFIPLIFGVMLIGLGKQCAYFNTYYNATQYFKAAVKESEKLSEEANITPTLRKQLDAVIEKTDNVISRYPTSRWAENALYLNARANYYKRDYTIARRKFETFFIKYPQSKLEAEALIWYGRTLWRLNEREAAFFQWNRAMRKLRDETLLAELYHSIAELYMTTKQIDSALVYYQKVAKTSHDLDVGAKAQFKIAELYLQQQNTEKAIENLKKVSQFLPSPEIRHKMQLLLVQIYRQSKQLDEAIALINERLNNPENEAIWGNLELQLGLIYLDKGDLTSALQRFTNITEKYKGKPVAAEAYYQLALLNVKVFRDYEKAQAQFESVIKEDPKSPYANEARYRAAEIKRFFGTQKRFEAIKKQVSELELARTKAQDTTLTKLAESSNPEEVKKAFEKQAGQKKGIDTAAVYNDYYNYLFEIGEAYYFTFNEIDTARYYYQMIANSSYQNKIRDKGLFCLYKVLQEKNDPEADSVKTELIQSFPYSIYTANLLGQQVLLSETEQAAEALFQQAEAYLTTNLDSALYYYQQVVSNYPKTTAAEKSVMNIAYIYHHKLFDLERALEWYDSFINQYPKSALISQFRATYEQLKRLKGELDSQSQSSSMNSSAETATTPETIPEKPSHKDERN
jgi:TolA-binding protein